MTKTESSTLLLSLGDRESRVRLTGEDGVSREFVLALGLDAMTPGPFRRDPPTPLELEQAILVAEELLTPLELEQAIMVVEDVLMPLADRIPPHPVLHLQSPVPLAEVLGGGGHLYSAGVRMRGDMNTVVARVIAEAEKALG